MHLILARRLGALVATMLAAVALGHVLFATGVDDVPLPEAIGGTPAYLVDTFVRGELGETPGSRCIPPRGRPDFVELCASWGPETIGAMMAERVPVDLQLIIGGLLLGTFLGVAAGRWCAAFPRSRVTRALHVAIALLLSCPPYFLAFVVLVWFSWNSGDYKLPFVSGQGDYRPFGDDPLAFLKAMWAPWVCCALPLAAFVARIAEASMSEVLGADFIRTAHAKGLGYKRILDRHALPVATPAIAAMTGVNVSTLLINAAAIEYGFAIPGMFRTIRGAVIGRDVAVMQALVLEGVILVVLANFLANAIQARLDPRVAS